MGRATVWNENFWNDTFDKDFLSKETLGDTGRNFPLYNMFEEDNEFYLELAVAGYSPSDIGISIENSMIIIESDKVDQDNRVYLDKNITSKSFQRKFVLKEDVDEENITAKFKDGMLIIHLPLTQKRKPKSRIVGIDVA